LPKNSSSAKQCGKESEFVVGHRNFLRCEVEYQADVHREYILLDAAVSQVDA
jgi:hypothetical protein